MSVGFVGYKLTKSQSANEDTNRQKEFWAAIEQLDQDRRSLVDQIRLLKNEREDLQTKLRNSEVAWARIYQKLEQINKMARSQSVSDTARVSEDLGKLCEMMAAAGLRQDL